jgi:hypothetical protein
MHGYLSFVAVALGAFSLCGVVACWAFMAAPWRYPPPAADLRFLRIQPRRKLTGRFGADAPITIGATVNGSGDPTDTFEFSVAANKKLVLQLLGPTSVLVGIWAVDSTGANIIPGLLRVCGANGARGCHLFKAAANCSIEVTNATGGSYSLKLREWNFGDYFTIRFYPSTC